MLLAVWIILAIVCITVLACALLTHYILTKDNKIEGTTEAWEEGKLGQDIAYAKISALDSEYMKEIIKSNDKPASTHTSLIQKDVEAIIHSIKTRPGIVFEQFVEEELPQQEFEKPALVPSNWVQMEDEPEGYNCEPYDDQLRAYITKDTSGNITLIEIVGE